MYLRMCFKDKVPLQNKTSFFPLGINKGSAIYLHLVQKLDQHVGASRKVAFYHRNTSESRKQSILKDLQLPLGAVEKKIVCVVATVSLGKVLMLH